MRHDSALPAVGITLAITALRAIRCQPLGPSHPSPVSLCALDVSNRKREHEHVNTNSNANTNTSFTVSAQTSRIQLSGCHPDNQARTFTGGTHQRRCRPSVSHWMLPRVPLQPVKPNPSKRLTFVRRVTGGELPLYDNAVVPTGPTRARATPGRMKHPGPPAVFAT